MDIIMSDLVGTADNMGVTALVQDMLADSILDRKIQERWIAEFDRREALEVAAQNKVDFATYKALRDAYVALGHTAAWKLQGADGGYEDANIAARLFSKTTTWRDCVDDAEYGRITALIEAL
jgi:hypothetical protein